MSYKDLISIIVPVYKVEKYIDRCVSSILTQTYSNLEIILIDDGSPDNCPNICENYARKDKRVKVIHKKNGGLSSARNVGISIAKGSYISFVDSDDWLETNAIELLYKCIIDNSADFVMGRNSRDKQFNNQIVSYDKLSFLNKLLKIGSQENVMYAWGKLYKRELFTDVQYIEGIICEDIPCTFELALKSNKICILNTLVYNYFINKYGITQTKFNSKVFDYLFIWNHMMKLALNYGDKDIINMVDINLKRADFGVLFNIAKQQNFNELRVLYKTKISEMLSNLKKNRNFLMKQKIPLSRKIVIFLFCSNYRLSSKLIRKIYR